MTYLGLRPGEKLYEELLVKTEELDKTPNSMIFMPEVGHGALEGKKVFCSDMTFDATVNPVVYEGGMVIPGSHAVTPLDDPPLPWQS